MPWWGVSSRHVVSSAHVSLVPSRDLLLNATDYWLPDTSVLWMLQHVWWMDARRAGTCRPLFFELGSWSRFDLNVLLLTVCVCAFTSDWLTSHIFGDYLHMLHLWCGLFGWYEICLPCCCHLQDTSYQASLYRLVLGLSFIRNYLPACRYCNGLMFLELTCVKQKAVTVSPACPPWEQIPLRLRVMANNLCAF